MNYRTDLREPQVGRQQFDQTQVLTTEIVLFSVLQLLLAMAASLGYMTTGLVRGFSSPGVPSMQEISPHLLPDDKALSWISMLFSYHTNLTHPDMRRKVFLYLLTSLTYVLTYITCLLTALTYITYIAYLLTYITYLLTYLHHLYHLLITYLHHLQYLLPYITYLITYLNYLLT